MFNKLNSTIPTSLDLLGRVLRVRLHLRARPVARGLTALASEVHDRSRALLRIQNLGVSSRRLGIFGNLAFLLISHLHS